MASFRFRSNKWQAIVSRKGHKPFVRSFTSKIDAEKWARSIEIELDRGTYLNIPNAHEYLFSDLITIYLQKVTPTLRGHSEDTYRLKKLLKHPIASVNMSRLTPSLLSEYRDERLKVVTNSTVIRDLSYISSIINYARRELGLNIVNPVSIIKKPPPTKGRNRILTDEELSRLLTELEKINPLYKSLTEFALETAMRRGELMSLLWVNVNFEKCLIFLPLTKNGHSRFVPLSNKAIGILKSLKKTDDRVFPLNKGTVSIMFLEATKRANLKNVHFHDLRHIAITRISKKITNVFELAMISGHRSLSMLQRYTHINPEDLVSKL
jgi:integrase